MRTTIELTDEQRAALMALAGKRRLRGYSPLVQEALTQYLGLPPVRPKAKSPKNKTTSSFLDFLKEEWSDGRTDGAERHDDYIYRQPYISRQS